MVVWLAWVPASARWTPQLADICHRQARCIFLSGFCILTPFPLTPFPSNKPQGDIVLTGCETAKTDWDETGDEDVLMPNSGPDYLDALYYAADPSRTPTIHAYDRNVRLRTLPDRPSLTAGRQHSRSTEGYQVVGPEDLSGRDRKKRRNKRSIKEMLERMQRRKAEKAKQPIP